MSETYLELLKETADRSLKKSPDVLINEYIDYLDFMEPIQEIEGLSEIDLPDSLKGYFLTLQNKQKELQKALAAARDSGAKPEAIAKIRNSLETVAGKITAVTKKGKDMLSQSEKIPTGIAHQVKRGVAMAKRGGEIVSQRAKELSSHPGAKYVAAGAAVAAASVAAYKIYKRFFSQAAKACKGKSGGEKTACMNQYKAKGLKAAKAEIMKGASKCSKAKDPAKCKDSIKKKALKYDAKIKKLAG